MELLTVISLIFVGVALGMWIFNKWSYPSDGPPGPITFPILGILPHFLGTKTFVDKLNEWKNQYGNIFVLYVGSTRILVLHSHDVIKEAFGMEEFTGRPFLPPTQVFCGGEKRGLITSDGQQWETQRRFALRQLREFGFGKKSMESLAHEDIQDLIATFKKDMGQPISTGRRFTLFITNSLWRIMTGRKYEFDDPQYNLVFEKLNIFVSAITASAPAFTMEWLIKLAPNLTGWNKFKEGVKVAMDFIQEEIEFHKETFEDGNMRDYMDVFLKEIYSTSDPNSSFYQKVGEKNLLVGSLNLFAAGAETTSSTLSFALLYLSRNPQVQSKCHEEIRRVIGHSRLVSLSDRDSLPYISATILEVFRCSSLVPFNVPHCALTEATLQGYKIPKGTLILGNMYDLHYNVETWGDPHVFRPERFLAPDGKSISKSHPVIAPFSIGKRQCLGETLARNNIFLFLVSLLQQFIFKKPNDVTDVNPIAGILRLPPDFLVTVEDYLDFAT